MDDVVIGIEYAICAFVITRIMAVAVTAGPWFMLASALGLTYFIRNGVVGCRK